MNAATKEEVAVAALAPPAALKQIAADAGAAIAVDTIARINAGEISKFDAEAVSARLSEFVFDCCSDMRADGHGELDLMLFRDSCVQAFRVAFSAFRVGLTASTEQVLQ